ncbi:MAG: iron-containing alcohol dehydrogenase [Desulfobulbaceae bacterium]|uniref:Iron-containing alcohol dehydrogenase n=1 Tax=Candidatus Desulfobia pelagia TaxID=2841692 RepID=A0A8J6TFL4_9BACT|nr:iron-containing alcohol dehydrogenase [Candidatus Desulfobia pelagia]
MLNTHFHFHSPVKAHFGSGSRSLLPELMKSYARIGIISGKSSLDTTGMRSFLKKELHDKELSFFCAIEPNPSIATVVQGGNFINDQSCQAIVAVGGGSALDAAKAIAALCTNRDDFHQLIKQNVFPEQPLPVVAIPTTCGTGSEMNHYAIITDTAHRDKLNFSAENTFPSHALLDPELLRSLSKNLILATACDALTHALEGFISKRANPFSDTLALHAMERLIATLTSRQAPEADDSLASFLYASSLAGAVILHTGTTLLHSLGYYLTNHKNIHHGTANVILLPYFLKMLSAHNVAKHEHIASLFDRYDLRLDSIITALGCPSCLQDIVPDDELETMVAYAIANKNALSTPFPVEKRDVLDILSHPV